MKLRDLCIPDQAIDTIQYRCYGPAPDYEDMMFGYCRWTGKELESIDGDSYSLDDEIIKYEQIDEHLLIVYFEAQWIGGEENGN